MINKLKATKNRIEMKLDKILQNEEKSTSIIKSQSIMIEKLILQNKEKLNTPIIYLDQKTILVKMFNDQIIYLSLKDISVAPHIAMDGIWESSISKAWMANIKHDAVILDIGANFGYFGLIASRLLDKKSSKVYYFEPNPELVEYINKSIAINWLKENSTVISKAVSNVDGKSKLTVLKNFIGSSSLHSVEHLNSYLADSMSVEPSSEIIIDTVSIDSFCRDNKIKSVDLIKMDIEGYEDIAYDGMKETITKSNELVLFIEFTKNSYKYPKKFFQKMRNDFNFVWTVDVSGELVDVSGQTYEDLFHNIDDWVMLVFSKKLVKNKKKS